jgi:hypothetical protein
VHQSSIPVSLPDQCLIGENHENALQPDGSLFLDSPYVAWGPEHFDVTLEGRFTAAELRAIAEVIERKSPLGH